jgi:hypothetical protein
LFKQTAPPASYVSSARGGVVDDVSAAGLCSKRGGSDGRGNIEAGFARAGRVADRESGELVVVAAKVAAVTLSMSATVVEV